MSKRVLVCGSRTFADESFVAEVLTGIYAEYEVGHLTCYMADFTLIEGGARGADAHAAWWADQSPMHSHNERQDEAKFTHLQFPADWDEFGKAAGFIRNQKMIDEGKPDLVLAFIDKPLPESRGTADMVSRAKRAGIQTYVIQRM